MTGVTHNRALGDIGPTLFDADAEDRRKAALRAEQAQIEAQRNIYAAGLDNREIMHKRTRKQEALFKKKLRELTWRSLEIDRELSE